MKLLGRLFLLISFFLIGGYGLFPGSDGYNTGYTPAKFPGKSGVIHASHIANNLLPSLDVLSPPLHSQNDKIYIEEYEEESDKFSTASKSQESSNYFTDFYSNVSNHLYSSVKKRLLSTEFIPGLSPGRYLLFQVFRI